MCCSMVSNLRACTCDVCSQQRVINIMLFFFKQNTAYEMRISDWSSDVCSSDLRSRSTGVIDIEKALQIAEIVRRAQGFDAGIRQRSEERRVGKECVRTCRSRWPPYH